MFCICLIIKVNVLIALKEKINKLVNYTNSIATNGSKILYWIIIIKNYCNEIKRQDKSGSDKHNDIILYLFVTVRWRSKTSTKLDISGITNDTTFIIYMDYPDI